MKKLFFLLALLSYFHFSDAQTREKVKINNIIIEHYLKDNKKDKSIDGLIDVNTLEQNHWLGFGLHFSDAQGNEIDSYDVNHPFLTIEIKTDLEFSALYIINTNIENSIKPNIKKFESYTDIKKYLKDISLQDIKNQNWDINTIYKNLNEISISGTDNLDTLISIKNLQKLTYIKIHGQCRKLIPPLVKPKPLQPKAPVPVVLNKNTIHIKNLEISTKDLPREHSFWDANNACMSLGNGWNLPTREEFLLIVGEPADNAALPYCGSQYSRLEALSFRTDMYYAMGRDEMACVMDFHVSKLSYITDASLYKIALPTRCVLHYTDIIGTPIKLNNLEIAQHDFKNPMKYDEATYACNQLGDGWRLPTSDELKSIALSIDSIGSPGFCAGASYWSSTNYETGLKEIPKDIVIKTSVWLEFKRPYTGTTSGVFISLPTFPEFANNPYSGRYIAIKKGYEYPLMVRAVRTIN